ncbi:MAG: HIT family protein [Flavobacteriales bacterium]
MSEPCPFCSPDREILLEEPDAYAIFDGYPVSKGHALVIPNRHVASIFDLTWKEQEACALLVGDVKDYLLDHYAPDGFNIGFNDGKAAGQTVFHSHIHVIPRYQGDLEDPEGGLRQLMPGKGSYRSPKG